MLFPGINLLGAPILGKQLLENRNNKNKTKEAYLQNEEGYYKDENQN